MAEALAVLGAAAAALQFAEVGFKIVSRGSALVRKSREYPECLQRAHSQIQNLIYLAKVTADNADAFQVAASTSQHVANQHGLQSADSQSASLAVTSIQLENVWKDCFRQAEIMDDILQNMIREVEGKGLIGIWRKLRRQERLDSIEKALSELERSKATLDLWLGNESLRRMGHIHRDLTLMNDRIVHCEASLPGLLENHHQMNENVISTVTQSVSQTTSSNGEICKIQSTPPTVTKRSANIPKQLNSSSSNDAIFVPQTANQQRNPRSTKKYYKGHRLQHFDNSNINFSSFNKVEWNRVLTLAGNTAVVQLGSQRKLPSKKAGKNDRNKFLSIYIRLRTTWLFDAIEINFSLQQYSSAQSIQASLKTQIRVEGLPLETFFKYIYGYRKSAQLTYIEEIPSREKQEYLFNVARRLLLQNFYAGRASPNDIDSRGRTLLHLQSELYRPGYEILFTKMTEFLISWGISPEVMNDDLETAQSDFCMKILSFSVAPHALTGQPLLSWTGPLKRWHTGALHILQCIRYWPEAILDTDYERICDIVLRKSIDDLQKFINQDDHTSMKRDKLNSPLHFAAAASWPEGVELLISFGYDRFQKDVDGISPVEHATIVRCIPTIRILLSGDCRELFKHTCSTTSLKSELHWVILRTAYIDSPELHDVVIECLSRHKFLFQKLLPYHYLAGLWQMDTIDFVRKLFAAGFQDIDAYDSSGYTPLMKASANRNIGMMSFLIQNGADPNKFHENVGLRPGHFLRYDHINSYREFGFVKEFDHEFKVHAARLLEAAFDTSVDVESQCHCSPGGFSPITSLFQDFPPTAFHIKKKILKKMISNLDCTINDEKRHWRTAVVAEVFNRLEMTHTCLTLEPEIRSFPEESRMEIEDEEEDLFFQLQEIVARFDLFLESLESDISEHVEKFFDDLDAELRPCNLRWMPIKASDGLGSGECIQSRWRSSRGKYIAYGHEESVDESSVLRWLF